MKFKIISLLFGSFILISNSLQAQSTTGGTSLSESKNNTFKIGPTNLFANTILLGYERSLSPRASVQLFGGFTLNQPKNGYYEEVKGFSGELQIRYYLKPSKNLNGFFVAPFFKYESLTFTNLNLTKMENNYGYNNYPYNTGTTSPVTITKDEANRTYYNGGIIFGYQLIIANVFVIDAYAGGGMKYTEKTGGYPQSGSDDFGSFIRYNQLFETGIAPKIGVRIGTYF